MRFANEVSGPLVNNALLTEDVVSETVREFTIVLLLKPLSRHRMHDHG